MWKGAMVLVLCALSSVILTACTDQLRTADPPTPTLISTPNLPVTVPPTETASPPTAVVQAAPADLQAPPAVPTQTAPTSDTTLAGQVRYIANTDGIGVRLRTVCDDQTGSPGWPEGSGVTIDYARSDCPGWFSVKNPTSGVTSWVREGYLSATAPPAPTPIPATLAPAQPTSAPTPPPTATPAQRPAAVVAPTPPPTSAPTVTTVARTTVTLRLDDDLIDPGQSISVAVIARSSQRLSWIEWRGDDTGDPVLDENHRAGCDGRTECAEVWEVIPVTSGEHDLRARAREENGALTEWVTLELRITTAGNASAGTVPAPPPAPNQPASRPTDGAGGTPGSTASAARKPTGPAPTQAPAATPPPPSGAGNSRSAPKPLTLQDLDGVATLVSYDGTYLGKLSSNDYDSDSVCNMYGNYGSKYSENSIRNPYGPYGNPYAGSSAYNPYSGTPPIIVYQRSRVGYVTKNKALPGAIDPDRLFLEFDCVER